MRSIIVAAALLVAGTLFPLQSNAATLAYPSSANASFLIDYPQDWEVEPGDDVGDYVTLNGPTGVVVQLRTIPGDESALEDAIEDTVEHIRKSYTQVQLGDSAEVEHRGMSGFYLSGGGVDADAGPVGFGMSFYALDDGNIAEIWFVILAGDDAGAQQASQVIDSLRTP